MRVLPGSKVQFTHCVTEEDAKPAIPQNQKDTDCKIGEYEVDGQTIRWTVDCQKMSNKYTGKRLGDCKK